MKSFKLNVYQRILASQAMGTWRGSHSELKSMAAAITELSLSEKEKEQIDYQEINQSAFWNLEKAEDLTKEISLEEAPFDAMLKFLKEYKNWPPSEELVKMFRIFENAENLEDKK